MITFLLFSCSQVARAGEQRWGFSFGYGGEGITATVPSGGANISANRSEGPLIVGVFYEQLISDTFEFGIEHLRAMSIMPATSEASFTGILGRWYFFGLAPSATSAPPSSSTLFIKRFVPFIGLSTGIARADIQRDAEAVAMVSGSGLYFGARVGADYATAPGRGIRPEIVTATTDFSSSLSTSTSSTTPPSLLMFSVQCSWYYDF